MELDSLCRCCLSEGPLKDMTTTHVFRDQNEVYSDMLLECFNLFLSTTEHHAAGICEACIATLRNSLYFKHQVLKTEKEFLKILKSGVDDTNIVEVKLEPHEDVDEKFNDDDLAEDNIPLQAIKSEPKEYKSKKVKSKTHRDEDAWSKQKIRKIIRLSACNSTDRIKEKKLMKNSRKITIKVEPTSEINVKWNSRAIKLTKTSEKTKHKDNLTNILEFSNATPFKNKSLLGFICGYCEDAYPDPVDLRRHTEIEHSKERLSYKPLFDLSEYIVKVDVSDLNCTLCNENIKDLTQLKEHLTRVHSKNIHKDIKDHIVQFKLKKGEVYDCAMCTSTYETFKMLKQHMNLHYSNYVCDKCDTTFAAKRSLSAHLRIHQEGSFKCDHCDKVFASKNKKQYHEKLKHLGARNISNCPFCDAPFRSYYQRNQHLVKVHNTEAQYKCNICNKSYILKSLLMSHIKKNHLLEKNQQCTECGYRFFSKKALKAHMVKHTGERIYSCEVCNKSYARKYTLKEHMRIHNNDRRFKCDVCNMTFVQKCSLKSHLLSNHGISMAASEITQSNE